MRCIPPNPRRVGYIVPIHGPLDEPLYMGSIYSNITNFIGSFSFPTRKTMLKVHYYYTTMTIG